MNMKPVVIGILFIVLVLSAGIVVFTRRVPANLNVATTTYPEATSDTSLDRYVPYTAENFARASALKRVLYFHADWCPICVPLDKEFSSMMNKIPTEVVVFKVNYDRDQDLKKNYAITYQHTFVQIDAQGNEVTKWSGGGIEELKTHVQ